MAFCCVRALKIRCLVPAGAELSGVEVNSKNGDGFWAFSSKVSSLLLLMLGAGLDAGLMSSVAFCCAAKHTKLQAIFAASGKNRSKSSQITWLQNWTSPLNTSQQAKAWHCSADHSARSMADSDRLRLIQFQNMVRGLFQC